MYTRTLVKNIQQMHHSYQASIVNKIKEVLLSDRKVTISRGNNNIFASFVNSLDRVINKSTSTMTASGQQH